MSPALLSLLALAVTVASSLIPRVNAGVAAFALAWGIGAYADLPAATVVTGFPSGLFLILLGVTFLFELAQGNGTLENVAARVVRLAGGRGAALPLVFFVLAAAVATAGPGNIAAAALLAPLAMAAAARAGVGTLLMTVLLVTGANAGAFSPFSMTGLLANRLIAKQGLMMDPWTQIYFPAFLAQSAVGLGAYLALGGLQAANSGEVLERAAPFTVRQKLTMAALGAYVAGVGIFKTDPAATALALGSVLCAAGLGDARAALSAVPWATIVMICGIGQLVSVIEAVGGLELFTTGFSRASNPQTAPGLLALAAGLLSAFSSSSGVVMPAFLPMVPSLAEKIPGADPVGLAAAVNVGSHLVDASPLSTLGAICLANAPHGTDANKLFRSLLLFGLSMSAVGGLVCWVGFGLLR